MCYLLRGTHVRGQFDLSNLPALRGSLLGLYGLLPCSQASYSSACPILQSDHSFHNWSQDYDTLHKALGFPRLSVTPPCLYSCLIWGSLFITLHPHYRGVCSASLAQTLYLIKAKTCTIPWPSPSPPTLTQSGHAIFPRPLPNIKHINRKGYFQSPSLSLGLKNSICLLIA